MLAYAFIPNRYSVVFGWRCACACDVHAISDGNAILTEIDERCLFAFLMAIGAMVMITKWLERLPFSAVLCCCCCHCVLRPGSAQNDNDRILTTHNYFCVAFRFHSTDNWQPIIICHWLAALDLYLFYFAQYLPIICLLFKYKSAWDETVLYLWPIRFGAVRCGSMQCCCCSWFIYFHSVSVWRTKSSTRFTFTFNGFDSHQFTHTITLFSVHQINPITIRGHNIK